MLKQRTLLIPFLLLLVAVPALFFSENKGILFLAKFVVLVSVVAPVFWIVLGKLLGAERRKAFLANLLLIGTATTICLIVAEVFVRHLYDDVTTTGDYRSYFTYRWITKHPPVINKLGFREREITRKKATGVYRIIVVGDSFTFGQGILDGARFTKIIERRLNSAQLSDTRTYEVLNFGKPGAATIDHISFLDPVFELDPDFILLQWLPNDVEGHDISARPEPYRLIPSDYVSGWLHRNSALFYMIKTGLNVLQTKLGLIESYNGSMLKRFADPESDDSRRANSEMDDFILRVKEKSILLGIVLFPSLIDTEGDPDNFSYGFLFDRVLEACHQQAIQCLDLRPALARVSPASKLWLHQFDAHPSPLTNEVAAEAILEEFGKTW
jgi:hypothetical protein